MRRLQFPRARGAAGGRAPQIGPGVFLGRTAGQGGARPDVFTFVVYSAGTSDPDDELWCFRTNDITVNALVKLRDEDEDRTRISITHPEYATVANHSTMWIDRVPEPEQFTPPNNPLGLDAENALKAYAIERSLVLHNVETELTDWEVRSARPSAQASIASDELKIKNDLYFVRQADQPISANSTAWVWVSEDGGREVWFLYRPGEPGGFSRVGTTLASTGQLHTSTRLVFERIGPHDSVQYTNELDPTNPVDVLIHVDDPAFSIFHIGQKIRWEIGSPVLDPANELRVDDFRISPSV